MEKLFNVVKAVAMYVRRNAARIVDIGETILKVAERVINLAVELAPMTPTAKDDVIVGRVHTGFVAVRGGFDKVRDFLSPHADN